MENTTLLTPTKHNLETLHMQYSPMIYRICLRYVKNVSDAQDLAQDILLKIHGSLPHFEGQSQLTTWIYRIAANYSLDFLRWKKRQGELSSQYASYLQDFPRGHDQKPSASEILLEKLMGQMDEETRQIIFLRLDVGLTHLEISQICGVSRVAITKRLAKFTTKMQTLRAKFQNLQSWENYCETLCVND